MDIKLVTVRQTIHDDFAYIYEAVFQDRSKRFIKRSKKRYHVAYYMQKDAVKKGYRFDKRFRFRTNPAKYLKSVEATFFILPSSKIGKVDQNHCKKEGN